MTTVAFLGLGLMGTPMARRLLAAGNDLIVWNRTPERARALETEGARLAATPAVAAAEAEVVITMLASPEALAAVTEGPEGVAAGASAPTTVMEMSTVGPSALGRLAGILPEGVGLLDAPVLGSVPQAEAGSLRVFVGGPDELASRWSPLLEALGTPVHVGPLGSGAAMKLVVNSTLGGVLGIVAEALALADAIGLDPSATLDTLAESPVGAQVQRRRPAIEERRFPLHFRLRLARKDLDLVDAAAAEHHVDLRLASAGRSWFVDADDAGWGDLDYASIIAFVRGQEPPV